jgi:UDP-N-acetylmuramate--alanine ligase
VSNRVHAHFIGIGGAGMSGIARVLHDRGVSVTGSDLKGSRYSQGLETIGVPVFIGHDEANLGNPEIVVISSAIPEKNPELAAARERGIPVWPRAEMLAHLAGDLATVAVAGTHGKTTTSSMVAIMLDNMKLDPTFLIGGEVDGFDTNARCGIGPHYVVEADESDGSFVFLTPSVAVVTNIEADHLDHYASLADVERTFEQFISRIPDDGVLVAWANDERLMEIATDSAARVISYGCAESADIRCHSLVREGKGHRFKVTLPCGDEVACRIGVPGEHNVWNATAALATAYALDLDVEAAAVALDCFTGVRRRFDHVGTIQGVTVVDDYAHHPTEIRATLAAAQATDHDRVWVVFQPHRYSRTEALSGDFGQAFADADRVVLMDVYGAGETPVPGVSGKTLVDAILHHDPRSRVAYLPHRAELTPYLATELRSGDLVMTMGAGDVTALGPEIVREIDMRSQVVRS